MYLCPPHKTYFGVKLLLTALLLPSAIAFANQPTEIAQAGQVVPVSYPATESTTESTTDPATDETNSTVKPALENNLNTVSVPQSLPTLPVVIKPVTLPVPIIGGEFGAKVAADLELRLAQNEGKRLRSGKIRLRSSSEVERFYRLHGYQPIWITGAGKPNALSDQLLNAVADAENEGLRAHFYHHKNIVKHLRTLRIAFLPTARQLSDFELLISDAFLTYGNHLLSGRVDPQRIDDAWILEPRQRDLALLLGQAINRQTIKQTLADLAPQHPGYKRLRATLADYRKQQQDRGDWPKLSYGEKFSQDSNGQRVLELRHRLTASGDLAPALTSGSETLFDAELAEAVRAFQGRHGLKQDAVDGPATQRALNASIKKRIQEIELNMERWRWLPEEFGKRHIMVNIPDYKMSVVENGHPVLDARAVVGRNERQTPLMSASMSHLVLSPYWYVPKTIAVEDKIPLLRKNPYALKRQGIRIFSGNREIDPGRVNWHRVNERNYSYTMRQNPGKKNALGRIKFMFPNRESIYIHDTPSKHLFKRDKRDYSSGCVRIDSPVELAEYLLRDSGDWDRDLIVKQSKRKSQRRVNLQQEVPVHLMYWTVWADDNGLVNFRDDIYQLDKNLAKAFYSS